MISFVKYRYVTAIFSCLIMALFLAVAFYNFQNRGTVFSYSVDFTGGTQVLLKFNENIDSLAVKNVLLAGGFEGVSTRNFSPTEIMIRVKTFSNDAQGIALRMQELLARDLPGSNSIILQNEAVGPGIGEEIRWKSLKAILLVLVILLLYIAIRFASFAFAAGAVVALMHDALIMLAVFLFLDREISINVMGAILAVLGYSINDTIVIFSQIRKNIAKMKGVPLADVIDTSLNQTLTRTLMTSISTGLVVLPMLLLGGEALKDFSLALLVGVIFGTYSSIYIASPIMMFFSNQKSS